MKQESKKIIALPMAWPYWRATQQQPGYLYPILGGASNSTIQYNNRRSHCAIDNAIPHSCYFLYKRQAVIIDIMAAQTLNCC